MKKTVKNILAFSVIGAMLLSGCSGALKSNFSYSENYEKVGATTEYSIIENNTDFTGNVGEVTLNEGDTYAVIRVKKYGDITVKLFPEGAPYAVQNFIDLANSGYYDGKSVHRVVSDFMLQGGSPNGDGAGGVDSNGGSFSNEINAKLRHFYGALCYASAMGSNSCQFYIVNNKQEVTDAADQYAMYSEYYASMAEQYRSMQSDYSEDSMEYAAIQQYVRFYEDSIDGLEAMAGETDNAVNEKYLKGGVPFLDGGYTVFGQTVDGFDVIDKISAVEVAVNAGGEESQPVEDIIIETVVIMTK